MTSSTARARAAARQAPTLTAFVVPHACKPPTLGPAERFREGLAPRSKLCLPLVVASQHGWDINTEVAFSAVWDGDPFGHVDLTPDEPQERPLWVESPLGAGGTLHFIAPFVFRTLPGWSLLFRGPPNVVKHGIVAHEAIVETAFYSTPAPVVWQFTRPGKVHFAKGEACITLVPVRLDAIESFTCEVRPIADNPELAASYNVGLARRQGAFQKRVSDWNGGHRGTPEFDGAYNRGLDEDRTKVAGHRTRLAVKPFTQLIR